MVEKEKTKEEILNIVNEILNSYNQPFNLDNLAILNTKKGISFLANVKIYDDSFTKKVSNDLESKLKKYGKVNINSKFIKPCCEPPFNNISFEVVLAS